MKWEKREISGENEQTEKTNKRATEDGRPYNNAARPLLMFNNDDKIISAHTAIKRQLKNNKKISGSPARRQAGGARSLRGPGAACPPAGGRPWR
ncbi:MAG: hypothetical protein FWG68_00650, partial [Defluviitaleaceae bacterium]|nr:hypothetical protein [Defluviitaleaceae bacterium]